MSHQKGPINLGSDGTSSPEQTLEAVSSQSSEDCTHTVDHGISPQTLLKALKSPEFKDNSKAVNEEITYSWEELTVTARVKTTKESAKGGNSDVETGCCGLKRSFVQDKVILHKVTGLARPFELLAIMGASGAGKTTLLNVLTFRNTKGLMITGRRCLNGQPLTREMLSTVAAYVQQDDLFVGTLTVREHLIFQASLRLPNFMPMMEKLKRVEQVIQELGLSKCADSMIGIPGRVKGISGGEMKRLSFASELLTDPLLMFCDEPTSGLDSYMAQSVVKVLKQLAEKGKTIICTIHQPSSEVYALFDRILLMAEGRTAYLGNAENALGFFRSVGHDCPLNFNPSDFFVQTLAIRHGTLDECRERVDAVCGGYDKSVYAGQVKKAIEASGNSNIPTRVHSKGSQYKASWLNQFRAVLWRSWITLTKDPLLFKVRLAVTTFTALVFGLVYFRQDLDQEGVMNLSGVMFLMITNTTFTNAYAAISAFAAELPLFLREHFSGMYRTEVYFLSKTIAELPVFLIIPFVFATVTYWMIGFGDRMDQYLIACAIIILVANVAASFGYMLSCWAPSVSAALESTYPVIVPLSLFGGFFLNEKSTPVYLIWLKYLSWYRYGNEALSINQWRSVDEIQCNRPYPVNSTCITDGESVLDNYGFAEDDFFLDILILVVLIIAFRFLAFLGLLRKASSIN